MYPLCLITKSINEAWTIKNETGKRKIKNKKPEKRIPVSAAGVLLERFARFQKTREYWTERVLFWRKNAIFLFFFSRTSRPKKNHSKLWTLEDNFAYLKGHWNVASSKNSSSLVGRCEHLLLSRDDAILFYYVYMFFM